MHKREREPEKTIYSKTCMDTIVKIYVNIIDYGWLMVLMPMCKCINLRAHMTKFTTLSKYMILLDSSVQFMLPKVTKHTQKNARSCVVVENVGNNGSLGVTVISLSPWIWSLSEQWKHVHRIIFGFTVCLFFIFSFYYATLIQFCTASKNVKHRFSMGKHSCKNHKVVYVMITGGLTYLLILQH